MAKFDFMEFEYGREGLCELVFNAKTYTKEQAVEIFNKEYNSNGHFKCNINVVKSRYAKYFPKGGPLCHSEKTVNGGCYALASYKEKGIFPVWVITIDDLDINDKSE